MYLNLRKLNKIVKLGHNRQRLPRHRKVRGHNGLHSLLAADPYPDVGGLDHGHVVGAVPDGQGVHPELLLHYPD